MDSCWPPIIILTTDHSRGTCTEYIHLQLVKLKKWLLYPEFGMWNLQIAYQGGKVTMQGRDQNSKRLGEAEVAIVDRSIIQCISSPNLFQTHSGSTCNLPDTTYISTLFFLVNKTCLSCLIALNIDRLLPAVSCLLQSLKKRISVSHLVAIFYSYDMLLLSSAPSK